MIDEDPIERPVREPTEDKSFKWLGLVSILAVAVLLYFKYADDFSGLSIETPISLSVPGVATKPQEDAAEVSTALSGSTPPDSRAGSEATILPDLNSSDAVVAQDLAAELKSPFLQQWLSGEELIRKTVAVIDNASRGDIARKVLALPAPNLALQYSDAGSNLALGEQHFTRYNDYVAMVSALSNDTLRQLYNRFQPLLQQAYTELGNPNPNIDDALAAAFQVALETPEIRAPLLLQRVEGHTLFVDEEIENLPDVQKLLIRMGPDNRDRIKRKIVELQTTLFQPGHAPAE